MAYKLVLLAALAFGRWMARRDEALRGGLSAAVWLPTFWVGLAASRPVSMWLGFGGGGSTLEGSPLDAAVYLGLMVAGLWVLMQRRLSWGQVLAENWPVFLFYGYLLLSVSWAYAPSVSLKRWIKEFGNIVMVLVLLTEQRPLQAVRAVFFRCAVVLLPLSLIFLRYFPSIGRNYLRNGDMEVVGVTTQKNSLGVLIVVSGLILLWDWLRLRDEVKSPKQLRTETILRGGLLLLGGYLLYLCNSQTSMVCLALGAAILFASRVPFLERRLELLGGLALGAVAVYWVLDELFGITESIVTGLGRDMTFTGRTEVWRELLALKTDPLFGVGFMSFWDHPYYQSQLPSWVAKSAHNGYLDQYLGGGWVGVGLLLLMLLGVAVRINRELRWTGDYGALRFAILAITLVANFSESNFACMTPIGFLFLLAAFGYRPAPSAHPSQARRRASTGRPAPRSRGRATPVEALGRSFS
jgi:O-antigen ligase